MISMVIPTYNRDTLLLRNFERLSSLTKPDEILVIDDGGDDMTEFACEYAQRLGLCVRYIYNHNPGWSNRCLATNIGIRQASGDHILGNDAELWFETDVVAQLKAARELDSYNTLCAEVMRSEPYHGAPPEKYIDGPGGYVSFYRREWLLELGGWDENMPGPNGYDDCDIHTRLAYIGHPQVKVPGSVIRHHWHEQYEYPPEDLLSGGKNPNQEYWENKPLPEELIANRDHEWGQIRHR